MKRAIFALAMVAMVGRTTSAMFVLFDDFNVSEGHFGFAPNFSGSSVGESALSTADRVTSDSPFEGAGHQKLVLGHDGTATALRIRHLSGAAPFGSAQAGVPASNITFTTSAGSDGFIGFYAKTSTNNTGWTIALNLDDSSNTGAGMDMGKAKSIVADGQWHLYEWSLDDDAQWDPVTGIGGDGTIQNSQHSIDSIYIFANSTGLANQLRDPLYLDFVAKNDTSIANIFTAVPEAGSFTAVGLVALLSVGAVWIRKWRAPPAADA